MSSTLFGRGTHTQVGAMHRAEETNRELAEIRALLQEIKAIPETVRVLGAAVLEMNQRLDALNVPKLAETEPPVTRQELAELETRIEALKVLQAPQVTAASLQALERRLEAKIKESGK